MGPGGPGGPMGGPGGPMNNGPMGPGGNSMNNSSAMNNPGSSPMHDMNSPMGPNGGPNGMSQPMGSPMGGPMMVPSSKSSPMGMGRPGGPSGPDPTQPLPPSGMGAPGNGFSSKNSPIMGGPSPATTDPNYAQQYHNFQQQLYATGSSRSQGGPGGPGGHSPGMGPLPPHPRDMATPPHMNSQNWLPSGPMSK